MHPAHYIPLLPPAPDYAAVVLATGYLHPLHDRADVEATLAARGVAGTVLLDLLLANASATHRYFALAFDGQNFEGFSARVEPSPALVAYSKKAFKACPHRLDKILLVLPALRELL